MLLRSIAIFLLIVVSLTGLACNKPEAPANTNTAEPDVRSGIKPIADPQVAVIETESFGEIVIELYPNLAPLMVDRFKKLIREGFYNDTTFHRIDEASALIQGGDPLSRDNNPDNDGLGDSTYPNVPGEFTDVPFERGSVGAARREAAPAMGSQPELTEAQARDSANCQFFITLQRQPNYDEDYTLFGKVIAGLGNAEIIMRAPVEPDTDKPAEKITIKRISLQDRSKYVSASP